MTTTPRPTAFVEQATRKRNAWIVLAVLGLGMLAFVANTTYDALTKGGSQWVSAGLAYGLTAFVLVSVWLTRANRVTLAMWILIVGLQAALIGAVFVTSGLGLVFAVGCLIMTSAVASQTLPPRQAGVALISALLTGLTVYLLDLFGVAVTAQPVSVNLSFTYAVMGVLLLIYGVILARQFPNYSIRAKLIVTLFVSTVMAVGVLAFAADRVFRAQMTLSLGETLKTYAEARALTVGDALNRQVDVLQSFSLNQALLNEVERASRARTGDPDQLARLDEQWRAADEAGNDQDSLVQSVLTGQTAEELRRFRNSFPEHVEVLVTDKFGANIAATNRTSDYYQADENWWQSTYNRGVGAVYIGQPEFDESSQAYSLIMAIPLRARLTQEVLGILRTTVDLRAISDLLRSSRFGRTGEVNVLLPGGRLLGGSAAEQVSLAPEVVGVLGAGVNEAYLEIDLNGAPHLVSQAPLTTLDPDGTLSIRNLGWAVLVAQQSSEALQPVTEATRTNQLTGVGAVVMASLLALFIGQQLSAPIVRLTSTAVKVREGDLTARAKVESNDEIGQLAGTFNTMTAQLRDLIGSLEQRVAARTRALGASAEVSRRLSTILDPKQLVSEVVEQVRSAFDYYYAQIYIFDEARERLIMAGGTGEAGRVMLARGHFVPKGKGLVGWAAQINEAVLVADVSRAEEWLPNPLLPKTRAEAAVPIAVGGQVLGVLDVQEDVVNGLTQDDVDLLQSIANQVGIALRNSRAYEEARTRAETEGHINVLSQKLQTAASVEKVLEIAARELGQILRARRASVELVSPAKHPEGGQN
jgi:putative methionine-R-sulfoxide reductase with GAF domain